MRKTQKANGRNRLLTVRMDPGLQTRFEKVVRSSRRTKTSVLLECLEAALPSLEARCARALAAWKRAA
jgi:predicted transcriptional regulator